ncbi:MAG: hypothetical protein M1814_002964 [Vezdaea aestivalis]|nr:MAG: hypothetical protein M1814_002964 [Vezdaea aestivalis]
MWYHVSEPTQYLAITGAGIEGVKVVKKATVMPFQKVTKLSILPFDYSLNLQAMTKEKLQFALPAVFTIGPEDKPDSLIKYATLLTDDSNRLTGDNVRNHVRDIVTGIIEGETRVIVSRMSIEDIFKERQLFKKDVILNVQSELDQFGLKIYNANVKELQDTKGSEYFSFLSRKAHEAASNQAKIDVAEARMAGTIGEASKQGKTKQEISKIDAETAVLETQRKKEKAAADAELTTKQTELNMQIEFAQIEARRQAECKDAELQKAVETKRAETELERLRARDVTRATIDKESAEQASNANYYTQTKSADGAKYKTETDAEAAYIKTSKHADAATYQAKADAEVRIFSAAKDADAAKYKTETDAEAAFVKMSRNADAATYQSKANAEAHLFAESKKADAAVYREDISKTRAIEMDTLRRTKAAEAAYVERKKEADGLKEMAQGYGALAKAFGGPAGLLQYMMLQNNTHEKLALANAKAINGLQPKITVWNTGKDEGSDGLGSIKNIFSTLPPLLSTINDQTGFVPPKWMGQLEQQVKQEPETQLTKREKTNGTREVCE